MTIRQKIKQLEQRKFNIYNTLGWICDQNELLIKKFRQCNEELLGMQENKKVPEKLKKDIDKLHFQPFFFRKRFLLEQKDYREKKFLISFFKQCLNKKSTKNATSSLVKDPVMTNSEHLNTRQ